jgi:hypothetical protein
LGLIYLCRTASATLGLNIHRQPHITLHGQHTCTLTYCPCGCFFLQLAGLFCSGGTAALSALADTALLKLQTLPQVLGVLAFVYAGHSTFPVVQQSMARPEVGPRYALGMAFLQGSGFSCK